MCYQVTREEDVWIPDIRRGYVLAKFNRNGRRCASLSALEKGGLHLTVRANSLEMADELCALYKQEIYRLAERAEEKGNNT